MNIKSINKYFDCENGKDKFDEINNLNKFEKKNTNNENEEIIALKLKGSFLSTNAFRDRRNRNIIMKEKLNNFSQIVDQKNFKTEVGFFRNNI